MKSEWDAVYIYIETFFYLSFKIYGHYHFSSSLKMCGGERDEVAPSWYCESFIYKAL